jgi:hypothetical protein
MSESPEIHVALAPIKFILNIHEGSKAINKYTMCA